MNKICWVKGPCVYVLGIEDVRLVVSFVFYLQLKAKEMKNEAGGSCLMFKVVIKYFLSGIVYSIVLL